MMGGRLKGLSGPNTFTCRNLHCQCVCVCVCVCSCMCVAVCVCAIQRKGRLCSSVYVCLIRHFDTLIGVICGQNPLVSRVYQGNVCLRVCLRVCLHACVRACLRVRA